MTQVRSAATAAQQFNLLLVGLLAALALVLAALGLYGVTSYAVAQRTRELGIRIALGAERGMLLRLVLRSGTRSTVVGLGIGLLAALALTHLMASLLFGVEPRDPVTFAGVCVVFLVVSLAATLVPALRATRVDPVIALRS
jgi:ABC-type antimicrobial peptide transport system permease subunit